MESVNVFIKNNVKTIDEKNVYIAPDIPIKKLNNAIRAFKCEEYQESILAIYDSTLFGSAKDGLVFTGEKFIHSDHGEFKYSDICSVDYVKNITTNDKGKEKVEEYTVLNTEDREVVFKYDIGDKEKFSQFINSIISNFDEFKEENQLVTIAEMSNSLKASYLKVIVNMSFEDDELIDEKELAEIMLLMTRLELQKDTRFEIREYISNISLDNKLDLLDLIEKIKKESDSSLHESIMMSLVKDLINVFFSISDNISRNFKFLDDNKKLFDLTDDKIELIYEAIENDYKIINNDLDDNQIKQAFSEISAKALASGTPIGAVYLSGTVYGLSAAGMTSGLASLGMGGVLGLSSMATGIGVAALLGVGVYKGAKYLSGASELDKYKTKELILHEVIKQTHKTISLVIEDMNFVIDKLNDTIVNQSNQTKKIKKLVMLVSQFKGALKAVDDKTNKYQNSSNRLKCPKVLDEQRLKTLTSEPTKKSLYNFVIDNYEEQTLEMNNKKVLKMILKEEVDTEVLENISKILNTLDYFDVTSFAKGKIQGLIG